jgi:peptidoglycan/LPS O-acetylase OafA/YrhL
MSNVFIEGRGLHPKYRPDIDGMRAIAILLVVVFHAFPSALKGGFIGVDIFFVISGYLITTIIFEGLEKNSFSIRNFYSRRIRRIFPALILVLIACFIFGWFGLFSDEFAQLGKHMFGGATFTSNYFSWHEAGYFDVASDKKPLLHLWSLAVEEQFYIVWPLLLWLGWKNKFNLLLVAIVLLCFSFWLNISYLNVNRVSGFYAPLARAWELMIGSTLSIASIKNNDLKISMKYQEITSLVGLLLILGGAIQLSKDSAFPGWLALLPTMGALMLLISNESWINRKILSHRILVWLGLISFPLYLWHWPLLVFTHFVDGGMNNNTRFVVILVSILFSWITYRYIEKPIRTSSSGNGWSATLLISLIVVGAIGALTLDKKGYESRFAGSFDSPEAKRMKEQIEWPASLYSSAECTQKYGGGYCLVSHADKTPTVALIGDSHANHFYPGLSQYFGRKNENLLMYGLAGCAPFLDIDWGIEKDGGKLNCYETTNQAYKNILNDRNIKTIVLAFHHSGYFSKNKQFIDNKGQFNEGSNYDKSLKALIRTINEFEKNGKNVYLIEDLPNLNGDIRWCVLRRPITISPDCNLEDLKFIDDFSDYQLMLEEIKKKTSIKIFKTHAYISGNFPIDENKNLTYRDETHLSKFGSLFLSDKYQLSD